jgi:hypothetical protein
VTVMAVEWYGFRCLLCGGQFWSSLWFSPAFHDHAEHCEGS